MVPPRLRLRGQVDPDESVANLGGKGPHVVGPLVERPARLQIETGVMPMAGENAVADAAAREWKSHVRAAVVDGKHSLPVANDGYGMTIQVHDSARSRR